MDRRSLLISFVLCAWAGYGYFLTNLRVRGWMDYENLKKHRPDLIAVTVLGTRECSPAVNYTINPAVGFPDTTGVEVSEDVVSHFRRKSYENLSRNS